MLQIRSPLTPLAKGRSEAVTKGRSEAVTKGRSEAVTKGRSEAVTKGRSEAVTKGRSEAVTKGRSEAVTKGRSEAVTKGRTEEVTKGRTEEVKVPLFKGDLGGSVTDLRENGLMGLSVLSHPSHTKSGSTTPLIFLFFFLAFYPTGSRYRVYGVLAVHLKRGLWKEILKTTPKLTPILNPINPVIRIIG
jgi:hypothetical protein